MLFSQISIDKRFTYDVEGHFKVIKFSRLNCAILFFFTYYFDVAIIPVCFFLYRQYTNRQYIKYLNILMCIVNQNIWLTFLE